MRKLVGNSSILAVCLSLTVSIAGCRDNPRTNSANSTNPTDRTSVRTHHDEQEQANAHEHSSPATLAEGVAELKEHYEKIRTAFQAGDSEPAHAPLHEIGNLLEALPQLASDEKLSEEDRTSIKSAVAQLFEAYGAIDDALHAGKKADYDSVAKKLDESIQAIDAVMAKQAPKPRSAAELQCR